MQQQGDVTLRQTDDGGDISISDGLVAMDGGITTSAYLCLFGGNEQDDGREDNPGQYWGNRDELDSNNQFRSETQYLLRSIPAVSANLNRIDEAAQRDLKTLLDIGAATSLSVSSSITGLNRINLKIVLVAQGEEQEINFTENWKATV